MGLSGSASYTRGALHILRKCRKMLPKTPPLIKKHDLNRQVVYQMIANFRQYLVCLTEHWDYFSCPPLECLEKTPFLCYFNRQFNPEEFIMFNVPVTYLFDFEVVAPSARPYIMQEFARCGAKHLVLSDTLIRMIVSDPALADTLQKEMADNNLSFCDGHAPFGIYYDMHCPFPAMRRMMFARQKLTLEICACMHVDTVTIHLGSTRHKVTL